MSKPIPQLLEQALCLIEEARMQAFQLSHELEHLKARQNRKKVNDPVDYVVNTDLTTEE